eukprot:m.837480 g.837480  ORF g.837480 m.837480 type:complete len:259 (-) comp59488_c0_seq7:1080-1856(-)
MEDAVDPQDPFKNIPLPQGWERRYDARARRFYFLDHLLKQTTWEDPRAKLFQIKLVPKQRSVSPPRAAQGPVEPAPTDHSPLRPLPANLLKKTTPSDAGKRPRASPAPAAVYETIPAQIPHELDEDDSDGDDVDRGYTFGDDHTQATQPQKSTSPPPRELYPTAMPPPLPPRGPISQLGRIPSDSTPHFDSGSPPRPALRADAPANMSHPHHRTAADASAADAPRRAPGNLLPNREKLFLFLSVSFDSRAPRSHPSCP